MQRGHTVRVLHEADLAAQITAVGAEYCPYQSVAPRDRTIRHDTQRESELDRVIRVTYLNPTLHMKEARHTDYRRSGDGRVE